MKVGVIIVAGHLGFISYTNIEQKLQNKLHGPMHYKTGVICVFNGHKIYALL